MYTEEQLNKLPSHVREAYQAAHSEQPSQPSEPASDTPAPETEPVTVSEPSADTVAAEGDVPVETAPESAPAEETPKAETPLSVDEELQATRQKLSDMEAALQRAEQSVSVSSGRASAEARRRKTLELQMDDLQKKLSGLETAASAPATPAQASGDWSLDPASLQLTEEEMLDENSIRAIYKTARAALSKDLEALKKQVSDLSGTMQQTLTQERENAKADYWLALEHETKMDKKAVEALTTSAEFQAFAGQYDPRMGRTLRQVLQEAESPEQMNPDPLILAIQEFQKAKNPAAMSPEKVAELKAQIPPSKPGPGAIPRPAPQKPIYRAAEYLEQVQTILREGLDVPGNREKYNTLQIAKREGRIVA